MLEGQWQAGDLRHGLSIESRLVVSYLRLNIGKLAGSMVLQLLGVLLAKPVLNRERPCALFDVHGIQMQRPRLFQ